jgi:hypothetical protein
MARGDNYLGNSVYFLIVGNLFIYLLIFIHLLVRLCGRIVTVDTNFQNK